MSARRLHVAVVAVAMLLLAGCSIKHPVANLVHGKELFVAKCGACHALAHAGTAGTRGPNLDDAFREDRANGFKSNSIEGLVNYWIKFPNTTGVMPANLYKGQKATDVAAYVAAVAAIPPSTGSAFTISLVGTRGARPATGALASKAARKATGSTRSTMRGRIPPASVTPPVDLNVIAISPAKRPISFQ